MRIKRLLSVILMTALLLTLIPTIAQAHIIKNGDYIAFGTYNGEPIVWRTVGEVSGDSLEIISDKIITVKAFDGRHSSGTDYQISGGSGRWSNSNLRSWLNSSSTSVSFECGNKPINGTVTTNEYDAEAGFMKNFSPTEIGYLKKVTNTTAVNVANSSGSGNTELSYDREAETVSTNIESAYTEQSSEYIYLPSVEDIEYIRNNLYTFGPDYHKAYPTEEAVEGSIMQYEALRADNSWYYWLRDAMYGNDDSIVRCVTPYNTVEYATACDGIIGVRPMCTLDTDLIGIIGGDGSASSPYILYNDPWIAIEGNARNVLADSEVIISLYKTNIANDTNIEIYHNGKLIATNPDRNFNVTAVSGVNFVEARAVDANHNIISTSTFNFRGLKLEQMGSLKIDDTFDDPSTLSNYNVSDDDSEYTTFRYIEENGDGILYMDSTQGFTAALATHKNKFDSTYASVMVEVDFKFTSFGSSSTSLLPIAVFQDNSSYVWWSPLNIGTNGILSLQNVDIGKTQIGTIDLNVWYNMKVIVNNAENTITIILTDEREPDTQEIICSNVKSSTAFKYVGYINVQVRSSSDEHQTLYLSTLKAGGYRLVDNESMIGNVYPDGNGKTVNVCVVNSNTRDLNADMIVAIYDDKMNLKDVKIQEINIKSEDGHTYAVDFDSAIGKSDIVKAFLMDEISNITPLSPPLEMQR